MYIPPRYSTPLFSFLIPVGELDTVRFGYLDGDSNFSLMYDPGESDQTLYSEGYPPDGTPVAITHTYHTALVVIYYFLAVVGIDLSVVCLVFNFAYRKKKVIRLTTPLLNYVIVCGAVFMYVSVFFGVLPTIERAVVQMQCIVHVWAYGIGYLLVYGTILAKMWRVYQIFHDPNPNKMVLKAWHLMCVVGIITGFGVLLILVKTVAQALTSPQLVDDREYAPGLTSSSVLEEYSVWQCYESGSIPFVLDLLIFIYLGLLQLVGIILAFQTRKVKIPILNDSKSVTALIYISSIVLVVIVLITFILRGYINIIAALFSGGIILLATFFLVLSFIPKALNLYHDPTGDKIFSEMHPTRQSQRSQLKDQQNSMAASMAELKDAEKVVLLNSHMANLKETLKDKNRRIAELESILKSST
jgi:gamma-aminobutyric acid type B receptor